MYNCKDVVVVSRQDICVNHIYCFDFACYESVLNSMMLDEPTSWKVIYSGVITSFITSSWKPSSFRCGLLVCQTPLGGVLIEH